METNSSPGSNVMDALKEIAFDLRWSWNHAADELWSQLDPELWALTRNPWVMPQTVSRERLQALTANPRFREKIDEIIERRRFVRFVPRDLQRSAIKKVAYFSMEYMLSDARGNIAFRCRSTWTN